MLHDFSGMGECKRSSSKDQKSFPAFMGKCKKTLLVVGNMFLIESGLFHPW
jgi:hypothetical protein